MKHLFVSTALILLHLAPNVVRGQDTVNEIEDRIAGYDLQGAETALDRMDTSTESSISAYLRGKLLFFKGDYEKSLNTLRGAIENSRTQLDWKNLRDRVTQTKQVMDHLTRTMGPSGEFVFFHRGNADSLLIPYADKALTRQRKDLETLTGVRFQLPLRVVIVSDIEALSDLSGLSSEQIEATVTVGISKYNQIMLLSPRTISGGYPWLDTLAHELTHVAITMASRDRAPIWLHEGIAKMYESRWRGEEQGQLTPEEAYLLDRAARERRLIPLRRFHPSVSLLPNQEDAALAYAQVLSFMLYLNDKINPDDWVGQLLFNIRTGTPIDDELTRLTRFNLRKLYSWWEQEITGKRQAPALLIPLMKKKFKSGVTAGYQAEDTLLSQSVRRHIRIGDLLRLRGHTEPAVIEYRRALTLNGALIPEIADRLGGSLVDLKQHEEAIEILAPMTELYPNHSTAQVQLALASAAMKNVDEALLSLKRAIALDPFHPEVHCMLTQLYNELGQSDNAALEKEHCLLLRSGSNRP